MTPAILCHEQKRWFRRGSQRVAGRFGWRSRSYFMICIIMIPKPAYEFKMVLVGDSSVGKSSILTRFVDDEFNDSLLSTIGVDFKFRKIKINGEEVKLQIWDTAGQETFRSIVSAYYNSANAIVIVYDVTSYQSFESVKEYWLTEAENQNKNDALIFLVGNKVDDPKREVEGFSIEAVMEAHKIDKCFQVSAKNGTNVEGSFAEIAKMLIKVNGGKDVGRTAAGPAKPQVKLTNPQTAPGSKCPCSK